MFPRKSLNVYGHRNGSDGGSEIEHTPTFPTVDAEPSREIHGIGKSSGETHETYGFA